MLCAFFAALTGIVHAAQLDQGSPNEAVGYELNAIAAVVIGGASLAGGKGTIAGAVRALAVLGILDNMLSLNNVDSAAQLVIKGLLVIGAVAIQQVRLAAPRHRWRNRNHQDALSSDVIAMAAWRVNATRQRIRNERRCHQEPASSADQDHIGGEGGMGIKKSIFAGAMAATLTLASVSVAVAQDGWTLTYKMRASIMRPTS